MKNKKSKISIIMPVFNASKYLEDALKSILNQTFSDFILICIDDGSSDNSIDIIKQYASSDERISVYQNDCRMGAAKTRNKGIELSNSDYLIFLDADDIFDSELLELAYEKMNKFDLDLVYFDCMHLQSEEINRSVKLSHSKSYIDKYCNRPFDLKKCNSYEVATFSLSTCCRMYSRRFIEKYELRFQDLESSNDVAFSLVSLVLADNCIAMNVGRPLVRVRDHCEVSRISNVRNPLCAFAAVVFAKNKLRESGRWKEVEKLYLFRALSICLATVRRIEDKIEREKFFIYLKTKCENEIIDGIELDVCLKSFIERMQYSDCSMMDISDEGVLKWGLYMFPEIILDAIKYNLQDDNRLVVWGAGYNGNILLDFLKNFNIPVYKVTDGNMNNIGKNIHGYVVEMLNEQDMSMPLLIVTTPDNAYDDICKRIDSMGMKNAKVIDLKGAYAML